MEVASSSAISGMRARMSFEPLVGETEAAAREVGVAAAQVLRGLFQHQHPSPVLPG